MADSKLALFSQTGLEQAVPEVNSLARPASGPLLAARHLVGRNEALKAAFSQSRKEQWPAEQLAEHIEPLLTENLEGTPEQIAQVARYLADEYEQIGDAVLVCSSVTGKAFARITDEDFIQPADRPRDDGRMITPPKQLRPDLHGFLVKWVFDEEREHKLVQALAERHHSTELQRQEGDRRLLPVTRAGRAELTENLRAALPTLLRADGGAASLFFRWFDILLEPPQDSALWPVEQHTASYRITTPLADLKSMNLHYDVLGGSLARVGSGWARDIAETLAHEAEDKASVRATIQWPEGGFPPEVFAFPADLWLGPPEFCKALTATGCNVLWMPVEGIRPMGFQGKVGALVPMEFDCKSREIFDRWETKATVTYQLWVDWTRIASFEFLGMPQPEVQAEIVR